MAVRILMFVPLVIVAASAAHGTRPAIPWMFCWIGGFVMLNLGAVAWYSGRRSRIAPGAKFPLSSPLSTLKLVTLVPLAMYGVVGTFAALGHAPNPRKSFIGPDSGVELAVIFLVVMAMSVAAFVPYVLERRRLDRLLEPGEAWPVVEGRVAKRTVHDVTIELPDGSTIVIRIADAMLFGMANHAEDYRGLLTYRWSALVAASSVVWIAERAPRAALRRELWREVGFVAQLVAGWVAAVVAVAVTA